MAVTEVWKSEKRIAVLLLLAPCGLQSLTLQEPGAIVGGADVMVGPLERSR